MRYARLMVLAVVVGCLVLLSQAPANGQNKDDKVTCQIIYVPTPQAVVDKMLDMAKVTDKDVVYDLGCGDGRAMYTAALKYGAKSVGVDIDPERIKDCENTLKDFQKKADDGGVKRKLADFVEVRQGDALKVKDLEKATVVFLYMLDEFMKKLEPIAQKRLPKGARVVSHDFRFPNWEPEATVEFQGPDRSHTLYLYTVK
jgi:SAM-dependent methyltransferase